MARMRRHRAGGNAAHARALAKRLDRAVPWEVLETCVSPPASADGPDADMVANFEPRLRNLDCDKPHQLGGQIDAVYGDPLKKGASCCSSLPQTRRPGGSVATLGKFMSRLMQRTWKLGALAGSEHGRRRDGRIAKQTFVKPPTNGHSIPKASFPKPDLRLIPARYDADAIHALEMLKRRTGVIDT